MALPPLFEEAAGRDTIWFTAPLSSGRKVNVQAVAEPLSIGFSAVSDLLREQSVLPLLTMKGRVNWAVSMPRPGDLEALCDAWATAAGLGEHGFVRLLFILQHLDLVEADLQRFYGVDLRGWPAGEISTRRVVTLVAGLVHETASLFWSELADRDPLNTETIVLAQMAGTPEEPHAFLVSRQIRRQRAEDQAAAERMRARGMSGG